MMFVIFTSRIGAPQPFVSSSGMIWKYIPAGFLMLLLACGEPTDVDPLATAQVVVVSGDAQVGAVGTALPQPVVIRVVSGDGTPLRGVAVQWVVLEGGGTVDSVRSTTDAQGMARASWSLGLDVGTQALLAQTPTVSVRLEAMGIVGFVSVVGGQRHTCALSTTGIPYCWGRNDQGQLGTSSTTSNPRPRPIALRLRFTALAAGFFHTCGVTEEGEIYCWGDNGSGQLGSGAPGDGTTSATPRAIASGELFASVAAGFVHTCAVARNGDAYCWGNDDFRALGGAVRAPDCPAAGAQSCTAIPQRVAGSVKFKNIAAGEFHSCGTAIDGVIHCWGWNSHGELGINAAYEAVVPTPARVFGNGTYATVAAGARHTCALTTAGAAECWGRNGSGETGQPFFHHLPIPSPVPTAQTFKQVAAGNNHTCALGTNERVYCWGNKLGDGSAGESAVPVAATLASPAVSVGSGWQHVCAVVNSEIWCWGSNSDGQLGITGTAHSDVPVRVQLSGS